MWGRWPIFTCGPFRLWPWPLTRATAPPSDTCAGYRSTPGNWRRELGLAETDRQALDAAALLHDIGKLAVPEHIISKPGKLTPEEFDKMKVHPIVGAEILDSVRFPYPVVPIVRAHHEKWDGSGYPRGLRGEEIPIGARILSAVDCLDALASDRQYRRALPLDEAMRENRGGKRYELRPAGGGCAQAALHRTGGAGAEGVASESTRRLARGVRVEKGRRADGGARDPCRPSQAAARPAFVAPSRRRARNSSRSSNSPTISANRCASTIPRAAGRPP